MQTIRKPAAGEAIARKSTKGKSGEAGGEYLDIGKRPRSMY